MCGICGWMSLFPDDMDPKCFEKMNNIAKHRGPDDEGYMSIGRKGNKALYGDDTFKKPQGGRLFRASKPAEQDTFLFLGHRRLSIIDLTEKGHQPMATEDEKYILTFNGEIYNYIELREELEAKGYTFKTNSDTEVIIVAYQEWGEDCVEHFNGMWGFALWDSEKKVLFCSRDRLGAKPFYYSIIKGGLVFGSEIKQLCENPRVKKVLDEATFRAQIMCELSDFSEDTLIKDIKALPGGHNLVIGFTDDIYDENVDWEDINITARIYPYWDIDVNHKDEAAAEEALKILEDAIHLRTRSDAPIGVLLSGGVDSSSIVAEIADFYEKQGKDRSEVNTFTSCYNDFEEGDEKAFAQMVNKHCGVTENLVYPDLQDTFKEFKDMVWHLEGNTKLAVLGSYMMLKDVSASGVKVLINGQGADETMFGYERYYAYYLKDLLKSGHFGEFLEAYKLATQNSKLTGFQLAQYFVYFSSFFVRKLRCEARMSAYVTPRVKKAFRRDKYLKKFLIQRSLPKLQYNEIRNTQLTHILRMDDRLYMSQSLESRVPFIDYRYMEKAVKIPEKKKIQGGYTKYLLRKHFEDKVPKEVIWRKNKMGWPSPSRRWAERFETKQVKDLFDNAKLAKYFDIEALKKLYITQPDAYPVEKFFISELFVRMFDVEVPN